jgi:chloramphenicol 3-O phosphotransferase
MHPDRRGSVVILNGSSSAGKSSVAVALQALWSRRGECWVIFGWDDFVPRLPARWRGVPGAIGDRSAEGVSYRVVSGTGAPLHAVLVPGRVGRQMLRAYHRAVAAIALGGVNVLVEEVMISSEEWLDWADALRGLDVTWIGVRCDAEIAAARETARGDRYPGLARGTSELVHAHAEYAFEIDASVVPVKAVVVSVDAWLQGRR